MSRSHPQHADALIFVQAAWTCSSWPWSFLPLKRERENLFKWLSERSLEMAELLLNDLPSKGNFVNGFIVNQGVRR